MRWKKTHLSELASFRNGKKRPRIKGNIPVYGGNGILDYAGQNNFENCISIGRVGAYCGNVFLSNSKCWISDNAIAALPKENISLFFLYYLLKNLQLNKMCIGSGQPLLTQGILKSIEVSIPDAYNQRKIGCILSVIDDKIALNQQINKNLEEQAQAIFAEFLANHELSSVTVEDVILTANTGADAIQKAPIVAYDTGVRCVRVGDMSNQRPVHEWGFTQVTPEIFKQYQLHKDDIVITRTASLGLNRLIGKDLNAVYNNGLIRITVNQDIIYPLILFCQFQTDDYRNYISRINSETSVRPNMKINYLLKYEFDIPHISEQVKLKNILHPIFVAQENNISENQALSSIRDALLPRLMSGEIDVSGVEI